MAKAKKVSIFAIKFFYILFFLSFIIIFINTFFLPISMNYNLDKLLCFLIGFSIVCFWFLIYYLINRFYNKLNERQEFILLLVTFLIFVLLITLVLIFLKMIPSWDYGVVFKQAESFVLYGDKDYLYSEPLYLQYHSNNIGLFVVLVSLFSFVNLFKYTDFLTVATIFNAMMVGISILLMYKIARKIFGKEKAYFSLIISLFFIPLFTYIPIFYTDTLSMPFIMLTIYLYIKFNEAKSKKSKIMFLVLIILSSFIGGKIKMTTWIVTIAILIHYLLKNKFLKNIMVYIISITLIVALNLVWNFVIFKVDPFHIVESNYGSLPWQHYLMMGVQPKDASIFNIRCIGGYNDDDLRQTVFFSTSEESKNYNISEYKRRVREYGTVGYIDYLIKKAVNTWGEGSYFTDYVYKFDLDSRLNFLKKQIRGIDNYNLLYIEQGVTEAMLFMFCLLGISNLFSKKTDNNDYYHIFPIAIFGLFILLLFWETRSRYLYNFILLFILFIVSFFNNFRRKKEF